MIQHESSWLESGRLGILLEAFRVRSPSRGSNFFAVSGTVTEQERAEQGVSPTPLPSSW